MSEATTKYVNALSHTISGTAYAHEGQHARALTSFRRAIELVVTEPWDGKVEAEAGRGPAFLEGGAALLWDLFSNMALSASFVGDNDLVVAALDVAAAYAAAPEARRSLMLQQASAAFRSADFKRAEETFRRGAAAARADGKEADALLAEFYVTIARLSQAEQKPQAPELAGLARAAERAADAFGEDLWMADYILATAVRMSYPYRFEYADTAALTERAFDVFVKRQTALAGYDAGQESSRRDRRSFLEIFVGASYEADLAAKQ